MKTRVKTTITPEDSIKLRASELEQKNLELNAEVKRRREAEAELARSNQELQDFAYIASHQLRTPATGVRQYLAMVLEGNFGDLSDMQRDILLKAYGSNERQLRIVSDLLKIAQVDTGELRLKKTKTDINQLLEDVVKEESEITKERQQEITLTSTHDAPALAQVDTETMRMVLENIIDNASKYSHAGTSITVTVVIATKSVQIKIVDQGVGIAQSDVEHLFKKFARIQNPLSLQAGGSGLGLYYAKKIIDLHGGTIVVTSKPGKGTTFLIDLPK